MLFILKLITEMDWFTFWHIWKLKITKILFNSRDSIALISVSYQNYVEYLNVTSNIIKSFDTLVDLVSQLEH